MLPPLLKLKILNKEREMSKIFSYSYAKKGRRSEVKSLRVNCDNLRQEDLRGLISMLIKKGFEITFIVPYVFTLTAEIKGDEKDTQAIREAIEKEGFTEATFLKKTLIDFSFEKEEE